jgi:hypothetical protein
MVLSIVLQYITVLLMSMMHFFQQALKMSSIESYLVIIWVTVYIVGVNDRYLFAVTAIFVNMYMLYYYDGGNIWYN